VRFTVKQIAWLKVFLHLAGFLPLVWLFWAGHQGYFSADPAKDIQHFTGRMALKFLLATLLVAPLARYAKQPLLIRISPPVRLMVYCLGDACPDQLHLAGAGHLPSGASGLGDYHSPLSDVGPDLLGNPVALRQLDPAMQRTGPRWHFCAIRYHVRSRAIHYLGP
jgi:Predicted membrane protein